MTAPYEKRILVTRSQGRSSLTFVCGNRLRLGFIAAVAFLLALPGCGEAAAIERLTRTRRPRPQQRRRPRVRRPRWHRRLRAPRSSRGQTRGGGRSTHRCGKLPARSSPTTRPRSQATVAQRSAFRRQLDELSNCRVRLETELLETPSELSSARVLSRHACRSAFVGVEKFIRGWNKTNLEGSSQESRNLVRQGIALVKKAEKLLAQARKEVAHETAQCGHRSPTPAVAGGALHTSPSPIVGVQRIARHCHGALPHPSLVGKESP